MSHQLPRILIVDDEVHNRKGIKRIIEESDFQYDSINEAAGAAEARAIVNSKGGRYHLARHQYAKGKWF